MKRIFFLISSKHEFFEFLFIRKYFDNSFHVFLLIEDNIRTSDIYLKNLDSKIEPIYLPNIFYSKKIFSNILKYKTLIKKLKLLNVKSNDKFIFFYGGSLLYFPAVALSTEGVESGQQARCIASPVRAFATQGYANTPRSI